MAKQSLCRKFNFKTAVASAVISFNEGGSGLLVVFQKLGINPGYYTVAGLKKNDIKRIKESNRKASDIEKKRRKKLRGIRKGFDDKNALEEGETYSSGAF